MTRRSPHGQKMLSAELCDSDTTDEMVPKKVIKKKSPQKKTTPESKPLNEIIKNSELVIKSPGMSIFYYYYFRVEMTFFTSAMIIYNDACSVLRDFFLHVFQSFIQFQIILIFNYFSKKYLLFKILKSTDEVCVAATERPIDCLDVFLKLLHRNSFGKKFCFNLIFTKIFYYSANALSLDTASAKEFKVVPETPIMISKESQYESPTKNSIHDIQYYLRSKQGVGNNFILQCFTLLFIQPNSAIVKGEVARVTYKLASDVGAKIGLDKINAIKSAQLKNLQMEIKEKYLEFLMNTQELQKKYESEIKSFLLIKQKEKYESSDEEVEFILPTENTKKIVSEAKVKMLPTKESQQLLREQLPDNKKQKMNEMQQSQPHEQLVNMNHPVQQEYQQFPNGQFQRQQFSEYPPHFQYPGNPYNFTHSRPFFSQQNRRRSRGNNNYYQKFNGHWNMPNNYGMIRPQYSYHDQMQIQQGNPNINGGPQQNPQNFHQVSCQ